MKNFTRYLAIIIILIISFLFSQAALAKSSINSQVLDSFATQAGYSNADSPDNTLEGYITTGVNIALSLTGILFFGMALYAGMRWMTAQGNDEHITSAKNTLEAAIIGLAVISIAYAISAFIFKQLQNLNPDAAKNTSSASCSNNLDCYPNGVCKDGQCINSGG